MKKFSIYILAAVVLTAHTSPVISNDYYPYETRGGYVRYSKTREDRAVQRAQDRGSPIAFHKPRRSSDYRSPDLQTRLKNRSHGIKKAVRGNRRANAPGAAARYLRNAGPLDLTPDRRGHRVAASRFSPSSSPSSSGISDERLSNDDQQLFVPAPHQQDYPMDEGRDHQNLIGNNDVSPDDADEGLSYSCLVMAGLLLAAPFITATYTQPPQVEWNALEGSCPNPIDNTFANNVCLGEGYQDLPQADMSQPLANQTITAPRANDTCALPPYSQPLANQTITYMSADTETCANDAYAVQPYSQSDLRDAHPNVSVTEAFPSSQNPQIADCSTAIGEIVRSKLTANSENGFGIFDLTRRFGRYFSGN